MTFDLIYQKEFSEQSQQSDFETLQDHLMLIQNELMGEVYDEIRKQLES